MAYNPAYNKPTWASEEVATSTKLNQMVDNTEHNHIYKPELGPNAPTSPPIKMAMGKVELTWDGVASITSTIVTFATDSDHGDPGFINLPRVIITFVRDTNDIGYLQFIYAQNLSNGSVEIVADANPIPPNGAKAHIHWLAIGN